MLGAIQQTNIAPMLFLGAVKITSYNKNTISPFAIRVPRDRGTWKIGNGRNGGQIGGQNGGRNGCTNFTT